MGSGCGAATALSDCLAAVLGFGRAAGASFAGAWALRLAVALAMGTGFRDCLGDFPPGLGGAVLDEDVVVAADEVVAVVEVVESEVEEGSRTAGAGAGCWVLWVMTTRVRVRALGVCARFPWYPACVLVLVLWVVSCVVCGGVCALSARVGWLSDGGPLQLQAVWVCLLEAVEGAEEALLDAGHVLRWG